MGVVAGIGFKDFPKQHEWCGRRANVCFNYDTTRSVEGTIVRMDAEGPMRCIIMLDDGRTVLDTECQFTPNIFEEKRAIPPSMWQRIASDKTDDVGVSA